METRSSLAAEEAVKVKKCLGTLRYLWRNAMGASHDENVQTMKSFLCPSPWQQLRRGESQEMAVEDGEDGSEGGADIEEEGDEQAESDDGEEEGDEQAEGDDGEEEGDEQAEGDDGEEEVDEQAEGDDGEEEVDEQAEGDDGEEEVDGDEDSKSDGEEWSDEVKDALVAISPPVGRMVQQAVRVEDGVQVNVSNEPDSDDSLVAPTLRLGESDGDDTSESADEDGDEKGSDVSESEEEFQCSQVPGSGWMGKFYAKYGRFGKTKESRPFWPPSVEAGDVPAILDDIRDDFSKRAGDCSQ
jgi:hypothetical protein